jgi:hypothetical protein
MKILITNGGQHPTDKWAEATAEAITDLIEIRDGSESKQAAIARRVKLEIAPKLFDIFMDYHQALMDAEKAALTKKNSERALLCKLHGFDPSDALEAPLAKVNAILADTPFKSHFAQEHVQTVLRNIIGQHSADVMHHEHRYHADQQAASAAKGA